MTVGFPVSPLTPATFLVVGLTGIELGAHQRFASRGCLRASVVMTIACVLFGVIPAYERRYADRWPAPAIRATGSSPRSNWPSTARSTTWCSNAWPSAPSRSPSRSARRIPAAGFDPLLARSHARRAAGLPQAGRADHHQYGRRQPARPPPQGTRAIASELGIHGLRIAAVTGDDVTGRDLRRATGR